MNKFKKSIIRRFAHWIHKIAWIRKSNPQRIDYYRSKSVEKGKDCNISSDLKFGTEPCLIHMGDHVRLTSNVQFVIHDGSLWVLRDLRSVSEETNLFGKIINGNNVNIGWNTVIISIV